jgi:hypothetical protein
VRREPTDRHNEYNSRFHNVANAPKTLSITNEDKQKIKTEAGIKILKLKRFPMLKGSMQEAELYFSVNQEQ